MHTEIRPAILTSRHLSLNPRAVRAAETLAAQGYRPTVLTQWDFPAARHLDRALMSAIGERWQVEAISVEKRPASFPRWFLGRWKQRRAQRKCGRHPGANDAILSHALSPIADALLDRLRGLRPTHLFVHHLDALGVAVRYRAERPVALFFDAEDDHLLELPPKAPEPLRQRIDTALARWLPQVEGWSTSAPLIGESLATRYPLRPSDATIWNTVPLPEKSAARWDGQEPLRVYWSSQTIGPGRGLGKIAQALAAIHHPIEWILRGRDSLGYVAHLRSLFEDTRHHLRAEAPCPPTEWPADATRAHLGLSLERGPQPNYRLNAPNKLFQAMAAGLAVIATRTPGQAMILEAAPGVGCGLDPDASADWAGTLAAWLSPENVNRAQTEARRAATDGPYSEVATRETLAKLQARWLSLSPAS